MTIRLIVDEGDMDEKQELRASQVGIEAAALLVSLQYLVLWLREIWSSER